MADNEGYLQANRTGWDKRVSDGCRWSQPVSSEQIKAARLGGLELYLTPTKRIPEEWLGNVAGKKILALASGGGQQGPLLAAAGAEVTVLDLSPGQLSQDRILAERECLNLTLIEGSMTDLSIFPDKYFDLVILPIAICYIPDPNPVWRECYRVLKKGCSLLSGFDNSIGQILDWELQEQGICQLKYTLPYADTKQLETEKIDRIIGQGETLQFGHTLTDQIGGQLMAGFILAGLYEDRWHSSHDSALDKYMPSFIATRATKLADEAHE